MTMTIKITVGCETASGHVRFTAEREGRISSALIPADPKEGDVEDLVGDLSILMAASFAYDGSWDEDDMGEHVIQLTDEELEEQGGGHWSRKENQ